MQVQTSQQPIEEIECDYVVVDIDAERRLGAHAVALDRMLGGLLQRLAKRELLSGEIGDVKVVYPPEEAKFKGVVVVGIGNRSLLNSDACFRAAATASKTIATAPSAHVVFAIDGLRSSDEVASGVAGSITGPVGQDLYREKSSLHPPEKTTWLNCDSADVERGVIIGESMNFTRHLVNEPPNKIYPTSFVERVEALATDAGLEVEVWDRERLIQERCEALLAVAAGSVREPRLMILRHHGETPAASPHLALIGKGVTFDSGGYSLKPPESMRDMKCDMAGAATVVGAMLAIARLNPDRHVVGLVGLVENMISGGAMKVGDVVTSRAGKTIEVLNTDAEGRMVLADVLDVAVQMQPAAMVDLATLTGACVVALGPDTAGVMSNNPALQRHVLNTCDALGEPAWSLPMFEKFGKQIRSKVADIKNVGEGRWGGAITAAKFLEEFVGGVPWVHIDIAGPAFADSPTAWRDAGASGVMVRTLVALAESELKTS